MCIYLHRGCEFTSVLLKKHNKTQLAMQPDAYNILEFT